MKIVRSMAIATIIVAGAFGLTAPAVAQDKGGEPWQTRICQYHVDAGHFENMGECIQRVKAGAERYCSYLDSIGYYDRPNARWKNEGQCKAWYRTRK